MAKHFVLTDKIWRSSNKLLFTMRSEVSFKHTSAGYLAAPAT